jgi:hypothetical protein
MPSDAASNNSENMSEPSRKLPDAEWRFEDVPEDLVRGAFIYEFFRQSKKLRDLIRECRGMTGPIMVGQWTPGYVRLTVGARQLIRERVGGGLPFEEAVEALVNCPKFPDTPALNLEDKDWLLELERAPAIRLCGGKLFDGNWDAQMQQIRAVPGIEYCFTKSTIQTREFESIVPLAIDWRKSNAEIMQDVEVKVLSLRPGRFINMTRLPAAQNAFGNLCEKLPFKPSTALKWIGVLRRSEHLEENWQAFLKIYDDATNRRIQIGECDLIGWRQERIKERDRARAILNWFETGATTPLQQADFR